MLKGQLLNGGPCQYPDVGIGLTNNSSNDNNDGNDFNGSVHPPCSLQLMHSVLWSKLYPLQTVGKSKSMPKSAQLICSSCELWDFTNASCHYSL